MRLNKLLTVFLFVYAGFGFSQIPELTPLSKISVLTSGPGEILYTSFGHSAFRVQDPTLGIDVVYNYGVFDPGSENFYWKFSQGRMYYKLVRQGFNSYLDDYKIENRWVKEQNLNLTLEEKNKLFEFLEHNNLPENKQYQYDYFLNNCATKIWDVLKDNFGDHLKFDKDYIQEKFTFRELIHHNIGTNTWGSFGIDLALGSVIDRLATPKEHMYLPIYVLRELNVAKLDGKPIAQKETSLFEPVPVAVKSKFFGSPLFFMGLISVLILGITFLDFKKRGRNRVLDFCIFLITGAAGALLFFLWFLTDHIWTVSNYNILWAFPLNLVLVFFVSRKVLHPWISKYLKLLLILLIIMVFLWFFKVQYFTPVLIPLLMALTVRYYYIIHFSSKQIKSL